MFIDSSVFREKYSDNLKGVKVSKTTLAISHLIPKTQILNKFFILKLSIFYLNIKLS